MTSSYSIPIVLWPGKDYADWSISKQLCAPSPTEGTHPPMPCHGNHLLSALTASPQHPGNVSVFHAASTTAGSKEVSLRSGAGCNTYRALDSLPGPLPPPVFLLWLSGTVDLLLYVLPVGDGGWWWLSSRSSPSEPTTTTPGTPAYGLIRSFSFDDVLCRLSAILVVTTTAWKPC